MPGVYFGATTAGERRLKFGSTWIGDWLEAYKVNFRRVTEVNPRHNFWSTTVYLDGRYPAVLWEHEFTVFYDATTRQTFASWFAGLSAHYLGTATGLYIRSQDDVAMTDFGNCFLLPAPELKTPTELLRYKAGMVTLKFLGNTSPTWY